MQFYKLRIMCYKRLCCQIQQVTQSLSTSFASLKSSIRTLSSNCAANLPLLIPMLFCAAATKHSTRSLPMLFRLRFFQSWIIPFTPSFTISSGIGATFMRASPLLASRSLYTFAYSGKYMLNHLANLFLILVNSASILNLKINALRKVCVTVSPRVNQTCNDFRSLSVIFARTVIV